MIRLFGFLLFVTSGIFIWLGAQDGIAIWQRTAIAEDAIGEVLRHDPAPGGLVAPVVRFRGPEGKDHDILLPPVSQPKDAVGAPVHLIYPPGRPDIAFQFIRRNLNGAVGTATSGKNRLKTF